jgi:hypothetical protein
MPLDPVKVSTSVVRTSGDQWTLKARNNFGNETIRTVDTSSLCEKDQLTLANIGMAQLNDQLTHLDDQLARVTDAVENAQKSSKQVVDQSVDVQNALKLQPEDTLWQRLLNVCLFFWRIFFKGDS